MQSPRKLCFSGHVGDVTSGELLKHQHHQVSLFNAISLQQKGRCFGKTSTDCLPVTQPRSGRHWKGAVWRPGCLGEEPPGGL